MALSGGFEEPVFDAQSIFRDVMSAFAAPGTIIDISAKAHPPSPLTTEAGMIAIALLDHETPVWCDQVLSSPAIASWLRFHTGAPITDDANEAAFAFVSDPARMPSLASFAQGSSEYPDRSTTVIVAVETLSARRGANLEGPGIASPIRLAPHPLPPTFWDQARANHALFPRGVDMLFVSAGKIAALPRSSRIFLPEA
jgi:alpha-D-ribose 1-methylphosphonate 5-triphosphate synthase subunit PhnH